MRILVCGGRDFAHGNIQEYQWVHVVLDTLCELVSEEYDPNDNWLPTDVTLIEGGAHGVDRAAESFAVVNFCRHKQFPADWEKYGKKAGYIRNRQMLVEGQPNLVVAFPGGKGTSMMVDLATKSGVNIIDLRDKNIMTMYHNKSDLKTMLNEAILLGDKDRYEAITKQLAEEYEETMKAQEIIDGISTKRE